MGLVVIGEVLIGEVVMGKLVVMAAAHWAAANSVNPQRAPQPLGRGWADQEPIQPLVLMLRGDHALG